MAKRNVKVEIVNAGEPGTGYDPKITLKKGGIMFVLSGVVIVAAEGITYLTGMPISGLYAALVPLAISAISMVQNWAKHRLDALE